MLRGEPREKVNVRPIPSDVVAVFLSDEWVRELDAAARVSTRVADLAVEGPVVVEEHVTNGPHGEARFHVVLDARGMRFNTGPAAQPDLTITIDYETAVALQRGETNAQHSLVSGRMKLRGDLGRLVRRADALSALGDVFASVRGATTLPITEGDASSHR
jgi:hypothetical protein